MFQNGKRLLKPVILRGVEKNAKQPRKIEAYCSAGVLAGTVKHLFFR